MSIKPRTLANVRVFEDESFIDRYTVCIKSVDTDGLLDLYTMSEDPLHPQGVNQYSHTTNEKEFLKMAEENMYVTVHLEDLPLSVVIAIIGHLTYINATKISETV